MRSMGFMLRGQETDELEIDIYNIVGGEWFFGGVQADDVRRALKANKTAKTIRVRINSEGGDVLEGFAIYNLLCAHEARVIVEVDALAASIASVIAMAGDEIRIAANAFVMIHSASGGTFGAPDELRDWADVLEKMSDQAADIYAARTGTARAKVVEMMAKDTWLTATEAKALGFADVIVPLKKQSQATAKAATQAFASMSLDSYANVPEGLRELVAAARAQRTNSPAPGGPDDQHGPENTGKETSMSEDTLKAFMSAQGVDSAATLSARLGIVARLEQLTGKTGEETVGVLQAWKQSHEELPTVTAKLAQIEQDTQAQALDAALAKAKDDHRHTPARETKVRELLAAKDVSHAGALAMVAEWGVIAALVAGKDGARPAGGAAPTVKVELKHNGKTFEEMTGPERAALKRENHDLYVEMRDASKR